MNERIFDIFMRFENLYSEFLMTFEKILFSDDAFRNLTVAQSIMLCKIGHRKMSATELQMLSPSNKSISYNVKALVNNKYIVQMQDEQDLRVYHIILTDKGLKAHDLMHSKFENQHKEVVTIENLFLLEKTCKSLLEEKLKEFSN